MPTSRRTLLVLVSSLTATTMALGTDLPSKKIPCGGLSDCAYSLLNSRIIENQQSFFVYQDQDSGFNHGLPALFADPQDPGLISEVVIDAGCIDDSNSPSGCSSDNNMLDQNHINVFRVTFPNLTGGQYVGLNFQDSTGYDLTPATQVQFDIRSPDQATVQISVGGCLLKNFKTSKSWILGLTFSIPSQCLTPPTNVLFTVAINTPRSGPVTVLLDNIQFTPVPTRQSTDLKALGLPLSTQTFGVVPVQYQLCPQQQPCWPPD